MASPIEEDTVNLAVTSSAAPWDGGALPAFMAVNALGTSPPDATTATHNDSAASSLQQQQLQQQQGGLLTPVEQLSPYLKRKLQPDHCRDAMQEALHSQKQRRLQIVEGYGGSDFRQVSQKRKAFEYAGLAPSSRSSKHLLAAADAQLYKKKIARSPSKASKQKTPSPAALMERDDDEEGKAVKRTSHHVEKQRPHGAGAGNSSFSSASFSSVHSPHMPSSPSLPSPRISQSLSGSQLRGAEGEENAKEEEEAPPDAVMALPTMAMVYAQQRRDSSSVHLHTPEVLAPTTPQKVHQSPKTATTTTSSPSRQGGLLSDLLSPYIDKAGFKGTPEDVAELQLTLSLSQASPPRQMSTPMSIVETPTEKNKQQKGWLPSSRCSSSPFSLAAPENKDGQSPMSTPSQRQNRANKRNLSEARSESHEGGSEDDETLTGQHSVRRVSSTKTLSTVRAQRPRQPTSASHRNLLRRQGKEVGGAESPSRVATQWKPQPPAGGGNGRSGELRRVRQSGKGEQASTSQQAPRQRAAAAGGDGGAAELEGREGCRSGQRQAEGGGEDGVEGTPPAPPAAKQRRSRPNGRTPPSVPQQQQQHRARKQLKAAAEQLPLVNSFPRSGACGSGEGVANESVLAGFGAPPRPPVSRSEGSESGNRVGKRRSQQSNSASTTRCSSDQGGPTRGPKKDVAPTSSGRLPELAHNRPRPSQQQMDYEEEEEEGEYDKEARQSGALALEAVFARHLGTNGSSRSGGNPTGRSSHRPSLPTGLSNTSDGTQAPVGTSPSEASVDDHGESHDAAGIAAAVHNGQTEPPQSRQPFLPTLPNRNSDGTVKRNPREFWKVASSARDVSKEGAATVLQKFAPLVFRDQDSLFAPYPHAAPQWKSGAGGGVTDFFGNSIHHNAMAQRGVPTVKRTNKREGESSGGKPSEYPAAAPRTQPEKEYQTSLHQQHFSVPSNRSVPRTRGSAKAHGFDVGRKRKEGGGAALSSPPPQHLPLRKPRLPQHARIKKKKAVLDQQWLSYRFAPYMAGMRSMPGGHARYNPTIAYHPYKAKALARQRQGNKTNIKKTKKAEEGVEAEGKPTKPAPIDYAALATQRDPLDYLLGRHGFWGESTTR